MTTTASLGTELVLATAMRELAANMVAFATLLESSPLSPVASPVIAPLPTAPMLGTRMVASFPYRSQWDDDGSDFASDCGPACVAMVLEHYGVCIDINQLAHEAGMVKGRPYTLPDELIRVAGMHGVTLVRRLDCTLPMLSGEINVGRPVIALIHYGSITNRQDQGSIKGHWVVVIGLDDMSVFINDPDWKKPFRETGRALRVPRGMFELAWSECERDGNKPNQCLMVLKGG